MSRRVKKKGFSPLNCAGSGRKRTGNMYKVCTVSQVAVMGCQGGSGLQERPVVSVTTLPPHAHNRPHTSKLTQSSFCSCETQSEVINVSKKKNKKKNVFFHCSPSK